MAGFGTSAAGVSPFGFGTPVPAGPLPPDPTGASRYIDPVSGDYLMDPATLQFAQMPRLRQRVLLAVRTVLGSSAMDRLGVALPRKMGTQYAAQARHAVTLAMRQMTDVEKVMRLDRVDVQKLTSGRSLITISYTDLSTGQADEVSTSGQ